MPLKRYFLVAQAVNGVLVIGYWLFPLLAMVV
jgi:hypothetical protein